MVINCKVEKLVFGGSGLSSYEGIKIFIPYSAPGDNLLVKVIEKKRDYYRAEIKKILEPSPFRVKPPCQYFTKCGGCFMQHLNYEAQLTMKQEFATASLSRIGHITLPKPPQITPSPPFRYRNKTQYPIGSRPLKIGYYKQQTHNVIDIESCLLHPEVFDELRATVKDLIKKAKEPIYNEVKHSGNLRHIVIRQGFNTNEMLLIYVTRTEQIAEKLYKSLPKKFKNLVGIVQNINPDKTNKILGNKNIVLWGSDSYYEKILDKQFKVSTSAFFQVNTFQAENIVKKLREYIDSANTVLDLYSGVGMLSIAVSDIAKKIYGIEVSKKAVKDANENLKLNNINNVEYIAAPVELAIKNYQGIDTIILDPPRKGCSENVLKIIASINPKKIIYISCNPTTFARDMAILASMNYHLDKYELVDMFPQTFHIESIAKIIPK